MGELRQLVNIGKELERQLMLVGVSNYDDLATLGSMDAWLKIKVIDSTACINSLMALEGAIQKIRWHNLSGEDKKWLKDFYEENK